jgi:hypothetical protein
VVSADDPGSSAGAADAASTTRARRLRDARSVHIDGRRHVLQRGLVPAERGAHSGSDDHAAASPAAAKRWLHDAQPVCGVRHGSLRERGLAIRAGDDDATSNASAHATSDTGPDRRLLDARSVRRHTGIARRVRERRVVSRRWVKARSVVVPGNHAFHREIAVS